MIKIKCYKNCRSRTASVDGESWGHVSYEETYQIIRDNKNMGVIIEVNSETHNEKDVLLSCLVTREKCEDVDFLNRIIRGGGFLNYIKSFENKTGEQK